MPAGRGESLLFLHPAPDTFPMNHLHPFGSFRGVCAQLRTTARCPFKLYSPLCQRNPGSCCWHRVCRAAPTYSSFNGAGRPPAAQPQLPTQAPLALRRRLALPPRGRRGFAGGAGRISLPRAPAPLVFTADGGAGRLRLGTARGSVPEGREAAAATTCLHLGCSGTRRDGGAWPTRLDGQRGALRSPASAGDGRPNPPGSCEASKKPLLLGPRCPRVSQPPRALGGSKDAAGGKVLAEPRCGEKAREPFL